jgi:hypothetical protein
MKQETKKRLRKLRKMPLYVIASIVLVLIALFIFLDFSYVQPVGFLVFGGNTAMEKSVTEFSNKENKANCGIDIIGHDAKYIYTAIGCDYGIVPGSDGAHSEATDWARFTYENAQSTYVVTASTWVGDDNSDPSEQQLFPLVITMAAPFNLQNNALYKVDKTVPTRNL